MMQCKPAQNYLGIDIGGTSAKCALVSSDGFIKFKVSFPTGALCTQNDFMRRLDAVIADAKNVSDVPLSGIGLCMPGIVNEDDGSVMYGSPNLTRLYDLRLKERLICHNLPVCVNNDANGAALGEMHFGAGRQFKNMLFIAYGTGIGGAIILDGRLYKGAHCRAGEIGYFDFVNDEVFAEKKMSVQALLATVADSDCSEIKDGIALFNAIRQGDIQLTPLYQSWLKMNARLIANCILLLDVHAIVVGGGISREGHFLTDALALQVDSFLPKSFRQQTKIVPARLGNDAGVLGAVVPLLDFG